MIQRLAIERLERCRLLTTYVVDTGGGVFVASGAAVELIDSLVEDNAPDGIAGPGAA